MVPRHEMAIEEGKLLFLEFVTLQECRLLLKKFSFCFVVVILRAIYFIFPSPLICFILHEIFHSDSKLHGVLVCVYILYSTKLPRSCSSSMI